MLFYINNFFFLVSQDELPQEQVQRKYPKFYSVYLIWENISFKKHSSVLPRCDPVRDIRQKHLKSNKIISIL
jgi:hypothetical protein